MRPRSGLQSSGARLTAYFGHKVFVDCLEQGLCAIDRAEGPCGRAAACCRAERDCLHILVSRFLMKARVAAQRPAVERSESVVAYYGMKVFCL